MTLSQLRIIGGIWRSRKISFPDLAEIRPTPDRVRETVFNWLAPHLDDAYCLDLFAGSGALGFEALSRGAAHVVMVDKSPTVIEQLRATSQMLNTTQVTLYQAKAPENVILPAQPFDIVFLDPPFHHDLIVPSALWLEKNNLLKSHSLIYIEAEKNHEKFDLPKHWKILKNGRSKQINYYLVQA